MLEGSTGNCSGGPTPWGTWLSCEEVPDGIVWECDPTGASAATPLPALGVFQHEAAAVDPEAGLVYLAEDDDDGRLYRFVPDAYPDLSAGRLEAALIDDEARVSWRPVPDPSGTASPVRHQVPDASDFSGGEGLWFHDGQLYVTTKATNRVQAIDRTNPLLGSRGCLDAWAWLRWWES